MTRCYFCKQSFKPEDFSTLFYFREDKIELIAHDDCLELFVYEHKGENLTVELGHKIWGDDNN